ncbi:MAG: hypothetical protein ACJ763_05475, partial [Bdellovibrionia bacterium]
AASQLTLGLATRHVRGSGMLLISSAISFLLGILLVAQLPFSALWIPGIFLAVDLVVGGVSLMVLSSKFRSMRPALRSEGRDTTSIESRRAA